MRTIYFIALAMSMLSVAAGVNAQTRYTCNNNGYSYQSTQPCPGSSSSLTYYGPVNNQQRYEAPMPKVGQAPDNLKYLNPRCAALNDAIRTGPARGLKHETLSQMRQEYSRECSESENEANTRLSQDRSQKRQQSSEAKATEKLEQERASLREQQCGESKRILFTKRARTDLNEGEKAELRRFEENYRSRCG